MKSFSSRNKLSHKKTVFRMVISNRNEQNESKNE